MVWCMRCRSDNVWDEISKGSWGLNDDEIGGPLYSRPCKRMCRCEGTTTGVLCLN